MVEANSTCPKCGRGAMKLRVESCLQCTLLNGLLLSRQFLAIVRPLEAKV
jgi:hypothetical protein